MDRDIMGNPRPAKPMEKAQAGDGEGGAKKYDAKKVPLFKGLLSYFPRAAQQVALVSRYGAQKYDWNGWEAVPNGEERYMDALTRHVNAIAIDGNFDVTDSNLPHLAQVAWNALAVLELKMRTGEIPLTAIDYEGEHIGFGNTLKEDTEQRTNKGEIFSNPQNTIIYWSNKDTARGIATKYGHRNETELSQQYKGAWCLSHRAQQAHLERYPILFDLIPSYSVAEWEARRTKRKDAELD
jgi:hypothetical protein